MRRLRSLHRVCSAVALLACMLVSFQGQAQSADEYRQALYQFTALLERSAALTGRTASMDSAELVLAQLQQSSDEEIISTFGEYLPLSMLQQIIQDTENDIQLALRSHSPSSNTPSIESNSSVIQIPNVNVQPSFCEYATGAISFTELAVAKAAGAALARQEFTCLESVAGENAAKRLDIQK